jgi:hypothetical protein
LTERLFDTENLYVGGSIPPFAINMSHVEKSDEKMHTGGANFHFQEASI